MDAGYRGTFVIAWAQSETDGVPAAAPSAILIGTLWRWSGEAVRVDGPSGLLVLGRDATQDDLHRRAARGARRLMATVPGLARIVVPAQAAPEAEDAMAPEQGFVVTDGLSAWRVTVIEIAEGGGWLAMFAGAVPPADTDLWVIERRMRRGPRDRNAGTDVLCFVPGTRIATPQGPRAVEELRPGDMVTTLDEGAQPLIWTGERRVTGARLLVEPGLAPVRIAAGGAGGDADLLVSPGHRLLLRSAAALALFGAPEVLVAARDLLDGRAVRVAETRGELRYLHLLLERHQILIANGVPVESFHPARARAGALSPEAQRRLEAACPGVTADPWCYGPEVRRGLRRPEAAVLRHALARQPGQQPARGAGRDAAAPGGAAALAGAIRA